MSLYRVSLKKESIINLQEADMKHLKIFLLMTIFVVLSACAPTTQTTPTTTEIAPILNFAPKMTMFEEGKVQFELGIVNLSNRTREAIKDANIRMIVTNQEGKIRNQMTIVEIQAIEADETITPLIYEAVYDVGAYTLSMTGQGIESLSVDFEIRDIGGVRKLAAPGRYVDPFTEFTVSIPD
jgi:hypothetical protein